MNYKIGEYVSYCSGEICLIDGIEKECFDGINEAEYFKLVPVNSNKSSYYVPCGNCEGRLRKLLTQNEILSLIDSMPESQAKWNNDKNTRKSFFNSVLKGNDVHKIVDMIHSIYIQQENQLKNGKKLLPCDAKAMNEAEHILYQEIAFVLGIKEDNVRDFIKTRLDNQS